MLRMLGLFMVMPVLAILAQQYPDSTPFLVGLAIGGYGLTQAVLQIPMGVLSDRFGRKPVIIAGLLFFALGSLVAALAENMWMLVLGRIMQGAGAIAGAVMALAADVSRESQRAKVMAIIGVAIGFSFYLALLLGPVLASQMGLKGIFNLTALLALGAIPLVWFMVPNGATKAPRGDTLPDKRALTTLVQSVPLLKLNVSVLLLHCLIATFFVQIPPLLTDIGIPLVKHWQTYLPILLTSVLGLSVLMAVNRTVETSKLIRLSILLLAVAFLGMLFGKQKYIFLFVFCSVFFIAFNYLEASFPALVSAIAPAGQKGSAMGIFASFQFFGAFVGGVGSGYAAQTLGAQNSLLLSVGLCVFWLLFAPDATGKQGLKRFTLNINFTKLPYTQIQQRLSAVTGVQEVFINHEENTAYLKADSKVFRLQDAEQALHQE